MNIILTSPRTVSFNIDAHDKGYTFGQLPQQLSKSIPYGSAWIIEANDRRGAAWPTFVSGMRPPKISALTTADLNACTGWKPYEDLVTQGATYVDNGTEIFGAYEHVLGSGNLQELSGYESLLNAYINACAGDNQMIFWAARGCSSAEFTITNWDCDASIEAGTWNLVDASMAEASNARYLRVRSHLQDWLGVSIDELASLLDLSPTTIVNLTKPGRLVRPKTVRKMMIVYGLLSEFQRTIGRQTALTWARTVGYRLLAERDLNTFEQYISTHIFPSVERRPRGESVFGGDDAELALKPAASIGRPSRI